MHTIIAHQRQYTPNQIARRNEIDAVLAQYVKHMAELHRELKEMEEAAPLLYFPVVVEMLQAPDGGQDYLRSVIAAAKAKR
jgi:hypothetical protein